MAAIEDRKDEDSDSDQEGFFMADFFTKDLDIEDIFTYTYGEGDEELTLRLKGVAREFGQTVLGSGDGTGLTVWRGAQELNEYLWARRACLVSGRRVLELGAGLGLVGLLVANLKPVLNVVTDGDDDCMKRLHDNFVDNGFNPAPLALVSSEPASGESAKATSLEAGAATVPTEGTLAEGIHGPWLFTQKNKETADQNSRVSTVVAKMRWNEDEDLANARHFASLSEGVKPELGTNGVALPDSARSEAAGTYDLILAADVVYQAEAVVPLVATVATLLERSTTAVWVLSFARRNVPVQLVIDEAATRGLSCEKAPGFECATSGENIYEFRWLDIDDGN